jgi:hypothetical protein
MSDRGIPVLLTNSQRQKLSAIKAARQGNTLCYDRSRRILEGLNEPGTGTIESKLELCWRLSC